MYLNVNIILIILLYQCLMIYTLQYGRENFRSDSSDENDCSLLMPNENDLESPIPSLANSILHPTSPPYNGHLNVKHNSLFRLTCAKDKILLQPVLKKKTKAIFVKCVKGHSVEFYGQIHDYKDFKCDEYPKWKLNAAGKNNSPTNGLNDCSIAMPDESDLESPIPSLATSKFHSNSSPYTGHFNIKRNSFFKLACPNGNIMQRSSKKINGKEILVKCSKGDSLKFNGHTYKYKDFTCNNNRRQYINTAKKSNFQRNS